MKSEMMNRLVFFLFCFEYLFMKIYFIGVNNI